MNNNQKTTSICMIAAVLVLFYLMSRREGWVRKKASSVQKTRCLTQAENRARFLRLKAKGRGVCWSKGYEKIGRRYCAPNKSKFSHVCMK